MKPSKTLVLLVVSLLALSLSYGAMALGYQRPLRQPDIKRVHDRLRLIRMWRLTDYLKLDEETSIKLFPIMNRYDDQRLALNEERVGVLKEIKAELDKETPNEKKLEELIAKAEELRLQMEKLNQDERNELKKVLSVKQQAKLLLFYRDFDRELYHMIRERKVTPRIQRKSPNRPIRPQPPGEPQRPVGPPIQ